MNKDLTRTINRLQAPDQSGSIPGAGPQVYHRTSVRNRRAANRAQRGWSNFAPHAALREVIPDLLKKAFFDR